MSTKILIIDDEYLTRISLADFLEEAEYETASVGDGKSALQLQEKHPSDICIVDIRIPGMDGIETILALHHHSRHVRYIIYTGSPQFSLTPALKKIGITDEYVIRKPVLDMDIFITLINKITNSAQER